MTGLQVWLKASRLPSQGYIFFPLLLGQSIAYRFYGGIDPVLFVLIHIYGLLIQLFIVYANDYADYETDKDNRTYTMFSGGSRTVVEGQLSLGTLKRWIIIVMGATVLTGLVITLVYRRPFALLWILLSFLLLWAYSYPPIRLSYRGGGEILQAVGVASVLPLFAYYVHVGNLESFPLGILVILFPIHLSCALSTALPDEPSDRKHRKRTFTVIQGAGKAKGTIVLLNSLSFLLVLALPVVSLQGSLAASALGFALTVMMFRFFRGSAPGTGKLLYFVSLNILSVLVFVGILSTYFFLG